LLFIYLYFTGNNYYAAHYVLRD